MSHTIATLDASVINGVGTFDVFIGEEEAVQGGDNYLDLHIKYNDLLPLHDVNGVYRRFNLVAILEEPLGEDEWRPFMVQEVPFIVEEQGVSHIFEYGPNILNFYEGEGGVQQSDGSNIIVNEYKKQGRLANSFRVRIVCNQSVENGASGAFESGTASISYNTYTV